MPEKVVIYDFRDFSENCKKHIPKDWAVLANSDHKVTVLHEDNHVKVEFHNDLSIEVVVMYSFYKHYFRSS